jgi:AMP-binding enzyme
MILGDTKTEELPATTLDDLFRRAAARRPDAIGLADPPNRESFTGSPPRHLTYAAADRVVSAIAARLRSLGLPTDTIVGIQLPNTIESLLTILGVLRAGMIAAPLPLLWRRADMANALGRVGARVIVTTSRIGDFDACAMAMQVAADIFPIRHVCSFGPNLPDVIALDELLQGAAPELPTEIEREGNPAAHIALVTFDVTPDGLIAVARNHAELIAGGLAILLEGRIEPGARLLGCCATGSFAGLALTMMPWLLSGGTLLLHHSFDSHAFAVQCREHRPNTVVVPGALIPQLAEAGLLAHAGLHNVLAVWRAPERCLASPAWQHSNASLTDVHIFGETALIGSRRGADGLAVPLPLHAIMAPSGSANAVPVADIVRTVSGAFALRGPMVPRHPFPPGAERLGAPYLRADPEGFIDTGCPCRLDRSAGTVTVTGPQPGVTSIGSYRFVLSDLEDLVRRTDGGAFITALPDALAGHRLAGISGDSLDMRAALAQIGVNPLVAEAFGAA